MIWKRLIPCVLVSALFASHAFAQIPKNPRAPAFPVEIELGKFKLLGGTIEAVLKVAEVDALTPQFLNGQVSAGLADMHLEVQLFSEQDNVFGTRVKGEFIPYQRVSVRIQNRSTIGLEVLNFDLAPTVSRDGGWTYGSNVALPPLNAPNNIFNDDYLVTVTLISDNTVAIHSDATPPATLFRGPKGIILFNTVTKLGPQTAGGGTAPTTGLSSAVSVTQLPAGNVDKQQALVTQFSTLKSILPDFVTASALYRADTGFGETLETSFQKYEDPTRYHASRGLTASVLVTAEDNVDNALALQPIGNDCNVGGLPVLVECQQWTDKGGQRMFYLNLLHEIDEILPKVAAGNINAVDGAAHNWDEAWAFWQAIRGTAQSREGNCTEPEFGPPENIDCDLVDSIDSALLAGSNAILNGGTGIEAQIDIIEKRLSQLFYLATYHEIVSMREKDAGDAAGFGKARAEGGAFLSIIAYLVPGFDGSALADRDQANFTQAVAQDFMQRLSTAMSGIVSADRRGNPATIP